MWISSCRPPVSVCHPESCLAASPSVSVIQSLVLQAARQCLSSSCLVLQAARQCLSSRVLSCRPPVSVCHQESCLAASPSVSVIILSCLAGSPSVSVIILSCLAGSPSVSVIKSLVLQAAHQCLSSRGPSPPGSPSTTCCVSCRRSWQRSVMTAMSRCSVSSTARRATLAPSICRTRQHARPSPWVSTLHMLNDRIFVGFRVPFLCMFLDDLHMTLFRFYACFSTSCTWPCSVSMHVSQRPAHDLVPFPCLFLNVLHMTLFRFHACFSTSCTWPCSVSMHVSRRPAHDLVPFPCLFLDVLHMTLFRFHACFSTSFTWPWRDFLCSLRTLSRSRRSISASSVKTFRGEVPTLSWLVVILTNGDPALTTSTAVEPCLFLNHHFWCILKVSQHSTAITGFTTNDANDLLSTLHWLIHLLCTWVLLRFSFLCTSMLHNYYVDVYFVYKINVYND